MLAWAAAGANDAAIDRAYQFVVVAFLGLGVFWTSRYLALCEVSPWWGLIFVAVPGAIASFDRMVLDGPLCALFMGFADSVYRKRWKAAYTIAVLPPLVRETGMFLVAGLVLAAFATRQCRRAAWFTTAAIPFLAWSLYVTMHVAGSLPGRLFQRPIYGILIRIFTLRDYPVALPLRLFLQIVDLIAILGYAISIVLAGWWRWRDWLFSSGWLA